MDGSAIHVYSAGGSQEDALPLDRDQVTRLATDPAFAVSAAPPPGTPGNVTDCGSSLLAENSIPVSASNLRTLNDALREADTGNLAPKPPLGAMHTTSWGGGLCQVVDSAAGTLTITLTAAVDTEAGQFGSGTTLSVPTPSGLGITVSTENPWDPAALETIARTPGLDLA